MATTWEKVLDDFNNRFKPAILGYLYKINDCMREEIFLNAFDLERYIKKQLEIDDKQYEENEYQYHTIHYINSINRFQYIDSKVTDTEISFICSNVRYKDFRRLKSYRLVNSDFIKFNLGLRDRERFISLDIKYKVHIILYDENQNKIIRTLFTTHVIYDNGLLISKMYPDLISENPSSIDENFEIVGDYNELFKKLYNLKNLDIMIFRENIINDSNIMEKDFDPNNYRVKYIITPHKIYSYDFILENLKMLLNTIDKILLEKEKSYKEGYNDGTYDTLQEILS